MNKRFYIIGDPFSYLIALFPAAKLELGFQVLILLRLYCVGLPFWIEQYAPKSWVPKLLNFTELDKVYLVCGKTDLRKGIDGLATIIANKYELALPLYRQRQRLKGLGLSVSEATLSNWVIFGFKSN